MWSLLFWTASCSSASSNQASTSHPLPNIRDSEIPSKNKPENCNFGVAETLERLQKPTQLIHET
jgi:hypothetical protein